MMDFTVENHKSLIAALQSQHYTFTRFDNRVSSVDDCTAEKNVILRHDVDLLPHNALAMAQLEHDLGIRGTYYFRIVPESFDVGVIEKIAELGHEIGYHYEDVDLVRGDRLKVIGDRLKVRGENVRSQKSEVGDQRSEVGSQRTEDRSAGKQQPVTQLRRAGSNPTPDPRIPKPDLIDLAMESFVTNLEKMRKIVDIKTICMHGSPMSPYDNRLLWTKYDYRDYGIIGEPYFDVDFSQVAYYTDTGRRWDGEAVSVRDKVVEGDRWQVRGERSRLRQKADFSINEAPLFGAKLIGGQAATDNQQPATGNRQPATDTRHPIPDFPKFKSTHGMIKAIEEGRFPQKAMLTIHPQRWHDRAVPWVKELVWQNVKNVGKRVLVRLR